MTSPSGDVKPTTPLPDTWSVEPKPSPWAGTVAVLRGERCVIPMIGPGDAALIVRRVNSGPAADALVAAVEKWRTTLGKVGTVKRDEIDAALIAYRKASEEPA